ncbi:MAG TPA: EAL domain-containing protein [Rhodocyclaceae bacterium]
MKPRLLAPVIALIIVFVGIATCVNYWQQMDQSRQRLLREASVQHERRAEQLSDAVAQQIDALIRSYDLALLHLRDDWADGAKTFDRAVRDVLESYPSGAVSQVLVFDAAGKLVYASAGPRPRISHAGEEHFRIHADQRTDRLFIGKPMAVDIGGAPMILLTRPILREQRFAGVIATALPVAFLSRHLGEIRVNQGDVINLSRADGVVMARSQDWPSHVGRVLKDQPFADTAPGTHGMARYASALDTEPRVFAWQWLNNWPLAAIVGIDERPEFKALEREADLDRRRAGGVIFVVSCISLGIALLVLRAGMQQEKLRQSEARANLILETSPQAMLVVGRDGHIERANTRARQMFGYPGGAIYGVNIKHLLAGEFRQLWRELRTADVPRIHSGMASGRREDGQRFPTEVGLAPLPQLLQELVVVNVEDVTARREAENRLRLAASVFDTSRQGIVITDAEARILDVNAAFSETTGYSRDEVLGQTPAILRSERQDPGFYQEMWQALQADGHWSGEIWNRRKNGEVYPELLYISAVNDDQGQVLRYVGVFSDITHIKLHEEQLLHVAHHDALTGLPNRVLLADRLAQGIAHSHRTGKLMAVCYLDLDGFKAVNDRLGHGAGDRLLIALSKRMKQMLRGDDTIARLGGDEFAFVLLDLLSTDDCRIGMDRLLEAIAAPVALDEERVTLSASIGVTLFPADEGDGDALLRHADQAMYAAKESGKNRCHFYDPEDDRRARAFHERLQEAGEALRQKEFRLYYQPKVDMRTGAVVGVEALIRWQHPQRGVLPPAEFLPAVELSDLAVGVGEWVLAEALGQIAAWAEAGFSVAVSVNISGRHLQRPDFAERLAQILAQYPQVDPKLLELEILETTALEDLESVAGVIEACRALGVEFALDDFGTGYSSLTLFRRLPARVLKIDQSFVRDMLDDREDMTIVQGVIGLATAFNRSVIAEGVETFGHGLLLMQLGCHLAQGYAIARPMPAAELPAWAAAWRAPEEWALSAMMQWPEEDLPMLLAEIDHKRWVDRVAAMLGGETEGEPPPLDVHECRLGRWYYGPGHERYQASPRFISLGPLHEDVHRVGSELLALSRQNPAAAAARIGELRAASATLVDRLHLFQMETILGQHFR